MARPVLVASVSTLLALGAAELAARARWTAPWYERLVAEQTANQELEYTENRFGLRDRDYPAAKPPGVRRVLVLGDSFTHGTGVARDAAVFPERLEAALAPGVEVLNGGLPGSLTRDWVRLFEEVADEFDPDVVLIVFFLRDGTTLGSTDYFDDVRAEVARLQRDSLLWRTSYLYRTWLDLEIRHGLISRYTRAFDEAYFGGEEKTREWRRARKNLVRLRDAARARGAAVGLAVFPVLVELNERYPFAEQVELLLAFGAEHDLPTCDLLPAFLGQDAADLWVSPFDQHPNERGHAIAAEALRPFVEDLLARNARAGR